MVQGLAISLPKSALVQSPLRQSACAHTHMHTRTRASSDARLAATRGAGRCSRWTRDHLGCGSYCRTSATRGVGSDSDFQVWGSSDDILLTSPTRGWLSDCACVHLLCRVPSYRFSGLVVAQCQGSRFVAQGGCARSGACMHGVWHVLDIHGQASQTVHGNSPSTDPGLSETSLTCRDESCIRECMQRVQVEVGVYRISEVCEPTVPVRHR